MNKKQQKKLDAQLDHWKKTDKEQQEHMRRMKEITKHDFDWFDLDAYRKVMYGKRKAK